MLHAEYQSCYKKKYTHNIITIKINKWNKILKSILGEKMYKFHSLMTKSAKNVKDK